MDTMAFILTKLGIRKTEIEDKLYKIINDETIALGDKYDLISPLLDEIVLMDNKILLIKDNLPKVDKDGVQE